MKWFKSLFQHSHERFSGNGVIYGWWVKVDGELVATLDFRAWDSYSQFWYNYHLTKVSDRFDLISFDPDKWGELAELQNRYATGFRQKGVLMTDRGNNLVGIRSLYVPESELTKSESQYYEETIAWTGSK